MHAHAAAPHIHTTPPSTVNLAPTMTFFRTSARRSEMRRIHWSLPSPPPHHSLPARSYVELQQCLIVHTAGKGCLQSRLSIGLQGPDVYPLSVHHAPAATITHHTKHSPQARKGVSYGAEYWKFLKVRTPEHTTGYPLLCYSRLSAYAL